MSFLLDTNILSAHPRRPSGLIHRFVQYSGRLYTSSISLAELYVWVFGRPNPAPALSAVEMLLTHEVGVVPFDAACAEEFGRLRAQLKAVGIGVDSMDLLIAATALVHGLILVTHNTAHFKNIPGLRVENWLAS